MRKPVKIEDLAEAFPLKRIPSFTPGKESSNSGRIELTEEMKKLFKAVNGAFLLTTIITTPVFSSETECVNNFGTLFRNNLVKCLF